jgi:endonuclease/exonuclease/phosphatase (EEP) superfamily protein YafD
MVPGGNPVLCVPIRYAGRETRLWLVHPPNPLFEGEVTNQDLLALGARIGEWRGSQIVFGDLNRTDASPFFEDFRRATGLRDTRYGFGIQPSWPAWSPYRIAIDHAFLSADLAVVNRRLGPSIGSDHLPLLLDVGSASADARNSLTQPSQVSR